MFTITMDKEQRNVLLEILDHEVENQSVNRYGFQRGEEIYYHKIAKALVEMVENSKQRGKQ